MKRPPMRSSIACRRCRKSKIKCDNDGGTSACETCIKAGLKCEYPEPAQLQRRAEPPVPTKRDGGEQPHTSERKRLKKLDEARLNTQDSAAMYAAEVLAAPYLTSQLWMQCFDIFKLHFATELPFLHIPTLKEQLSARLRDRQQQPPPPPLPSDTNLVLLGVLALTARFHADLGKYIVHMLASQAGASLKNRSVNTRHENAAKEASDYFATTLAKSLGPLRTCVTMASVERVQAFLMLGQYEWTQARPSTGGLGAWMYVGMAIRMAQALGLHYGDRPETPHMTLSSLRGRRADSSSEETAAADRQHQQPPPSSMLSGELVMAKEVRRRTMFSCLIHDRMLACGKERVSTIRSDDLKIQLPCSDMAFDLSEEMRTGFLTMTEAESTARGCRDSLLGRFIKLVDIWGDVSTYSFAGGRLGERDPPWEPSSSFYRLEARLEEFYASLPSTFTLSTSNYLKHDNHHAASVYISLHLLGCMCQIMLHREYVPFIPVRCDRPVGPLDEPMFPEDVYSVPEGYWLRSAERLFRAAKDIVYLIDLSADKLPMSGLVVFAVWTAAFVGIYAHHFPHMDLEGHMYSPLDEELEAWRQQERARQQQRQQDALAAAKAGGSGSSSGGGGGGPGSDDERVVMIPATSLLSIYSSSSNNNNNSNNKPSSSSSTTDRGDRDKPSINNTGPTGVCYKSLARMGNFMLTPTTYMAYFDDRDAYYTRVKAEYEAAMAAMAMASSSSDAGGGSVAAAAAAVRGGGLREWHEQNAKVVNNGFIMSSADPADAVTAETKQQQQQQQQQALSSSSLRDDRASSEGYEAALAMEKLRGHTPRSTSSTSGFTPINPSSSSVVASTDTPGGFDATTNTNAMFGGVGGRHHTPSSSTYDAAAATATTAYFPPTGTIITPDVIKSYIADNQMLRWEGASSGIAAFSAGAPEGLTAEQRQLFGMDPPSLQPYPPLLPQLMEE